MRQPRRRRLSRLTVVTLDEISPIGLLFEAVGRPKLGAGGVFCGCA